MCIHTYAAVKRHHWSSNIFMAAAVALLLLLEGMTKFNMWESEGENDMTLGASLRAIKVWCMFIADTYVQLLHASDIACDCI